MNRLIAFTGRAGVGKSEAAKWVSEIYGYQIVGFADKMKEGLKVMLDLSNDQVNGACKEETLWVESGGDRPITPRFLLQTLGTDWGMNMIDPDIWTMQVDKQWQRIMAGMCRPNVGMVIPDLRFDCQAEWVKSYGGLIIGIHADHPVNPGAGHKSEFSINDHYVDEYTFNDHKGFHDFHRDLAATMDKYDTDKPPQLTNDNHMSVKELIVNWANEVFPDRTITNAIQKMVLEEIPEYLTSQHDPMELADIGILLYDIAHLAGVDLDQAIRDKMKINKNRSWKLDKITGLMKHV